MRRNICIRMSAEEEAWLKRDGQPMSVQSREDAELLKRLLSVAGAQPHMPIGEAVSIANLESAKTNP